MVSVTEASTDPAAVLGVGPFSPTETEVGLYQLYITSILTLEERRSHSSSIFASVIAACVGAGGIADLQLVPLAVACLFMAWVWLRSLDYYADLARVKWRTALEIEANFPLRPFTVEYEKLKLEKQKRHRTAGLIARERMMPKSIILFSAGYLAFAIGQTAYLWYRSGSGV